MVRTLILVSSMDAVFDEEMSDGYLMSGEEGRVEVLVPRHETTIKISALSIIPSLFNCTFL